VNVKLYGHDGGWLHGLHTDIAGALHLTDEEFS
jgi:hypothetical protein